MLNVSPHLIPSHRCSSGASESGSQKGSTSPAVGKASSPWSWNSRFRYVPSLTSHQGPSSSHGYSLLSGFKADGNTASLGPCGLRPIPGQCGEGPKVLRARAGAGLNSPLLSQNEPPGQAAAEERHTCVVQYILFPPHSTSTKDR